MQWRMGWAMSYRIVQPLVFLMVTGSCLGDTTDDRPTLIGPKDLCTIIEKEVGGAWVFERGRISSRELMGKKKGQVDPLFYIFYALSQHDQARILEDFESSARPLAIVWAANGWTVVSDPRAWTSKDGLIEKLTALLLKYHPDDKSWKTLRHLDAEKQRKD
jgi:hypothetical protein